MSGPYCHIEAFINTDEFDHVQDACGDRVCRQLVSVVMLDELMQDGPATSALTPEQARELAFTLLACAEHAEHRTNSWESGR